MILQEKSFQRIVVKRSRNRKNYFVLALVRVIQTFQLD
jgi:hypothetical protein